MCEEQQNNEATFFRILELGNGSLNRWANKEYTTVHDSGVPDEWIDLYYKQKVSDPSRFNLVIKGHTYAEAARINFLTAAKEHESYSDWTIHEKEQAQILQGVCAYSTRTSAIAHLQEDPKGRFIATFTGRQIKTLKAEDNGFLVEVNDGRVALVSAEDFRLIE